MIASLFLAGKSWLPIAAAIFVGAAAFIAWTYLRTPAPRGLRLVCAALKLVGLAALLACLLEPMWSGQRAKPGANVLAIVADNSLSMKLRGRGESETRGEMLRRIVAGERSLWRTRLAENFETRNYLADSRLQATQDFHELSFEGRSSALGSALKTLTERHRGQPLAGVILLTDGVASDLDGVEIAGLPPIYPVVFGSDRPPRDIGITNTSVTQTSFEDAPVTVEAEVSASGCAGEEIVGKLFAIDSTGETPAGRAGETPASRSHTGETPVPRGMPARRPVAEQTLTAPRESEKIVFRFQLRPEKSGVLFYRLRVAAKREWDAKPEATTEATLANNETIVTVDRGAGPHRVLYVAGRPNWEYKFLHRAIDGDDQTQLVGLIRIAKREPKFEFRGRAGESSNPLFRGFGNQSKEDVERYDQPVLVRLNTQDEFELRDGFPKTAEELFKYRAVIVDDLEAEFFSADQMSLLQRFVSERGGGFLMLGGMESFAEGKYARTAIGDMLPVYPQESGGRGRESDVRDRKPEVGGQKSEVELQEPPRWKLNLTREGWLQPWARLRANEADEKRRLDALPEFGVLNHAGDAKPAAMVVATVRDGRHEYPALVTQRFGRGRTAALLVGDLWHSGLGDETLQKDLMKAWRQVVRWLVADVPEPIEVRVEPQPGGESVRLQVRARDGKWQPMENASVVLKVMRVGQESGIRSQGSGVRDQESEVRDQRSEVGSRKSEVGDAARAVTLNADASASEPGLCEANYEPRESGGYRVDATVTNDAGAIAGTAATGWTTDLAAAEFRMLTPNRALMESLARKTGGKVVAPDKLEAFARALPSKRAPVTETFTQPLWHTPAMFLFALACFVGEWGLRRWRGLA
jgi:hypothetical protein